MESDLGKTRLLGRNLGPRTFDRNVGLEADAARQEARATSSGQSRAIRKLSVTEDDLPDQRKTRL
jgi:hypothetical protein